MQLRKIIRESNGYGFLWPKKILGQLWANFTLIVILMSALVFFGWKISDLAIFLQKELEYLNELEYTLTDATQDNGNFVINGEAASLQDGLSDIHRMAEIVKLLQKEISVHWKSKGSLIGVFISLGIIDAHANSEELMLHLHEILQEIHVYISYLEGIAAKTSQDPVTRDHNIMVSGKKLHALLVHVVQEQGEAFSQSIQSSRNIFIGSTILALLAATIIIYLFYRSLIKPLKQGTDFAKQVAMGNLNAKITPIPKNEIGVLLETLDGMRSSLFLLRTLWESSQPMAVFREQLEVALDLILAIPCLHLQDKGAIIILNESGDCIDMMVSRRLPAGLEDCYRQFAFASNLCGKAAASGNMIYAEDNELWQDVHCSDIEPYGHFCIPFPSRNKVLGVLSLYVDTVYSPDDETQAFLAVIGNYLADIVRRKQEERLVQHKFQQNQIVGFPDQALFRDCLKQSIAKAQHNRTAMAVMFIDLNYPTYASNTSLPDNNQLLIEGSQRLINCLREKTDVVTHTGGDGFAIILGALKRGDDASVVATKILRAFEAPIILQEQSCPVGISIGIALYPRDGENDELLFRKANMAMYRVKSEGNSAFQYHEEGKC